MGHGDPVTTGTPPTRGGASRARLAPPRLAAPLPRERLFARVDTCLRAPVVWVHASAGFGKSALVSTYLEQRKRPCLWYQVEERDNDPVEFFHGMRLALERIIPQAPALPRPTAERAGALASFAREFFTRLFALLPVATLLILDDLHVLAPDGAEFLLSSALDMLPAGLHLILIGRNPPPAWMSRMFANDRAAGIDSSELPFTIDELTELARLRSPRNAPCPDVLRALHERTRGWPAAVGLLLDRDVTGTPAVMENGVLTQYLEEETLMGLPPAERESLMRLAFPPHVTTGLARRLSPESDGIALLQKLWRDSTLVTRDVDGDSYELHPLLREFLLWRAQTQWPPETLRENRIAAADTLAEAGLAEDAAELLIRAPAPERLAQLVIAEAPRLAREGRTRLLEGWITASAARDHCPWHRYWFGICRMPFDLAAARAAFEQAYAGFTRARDHDGRALSAAAAVQTYIYEWGDFHPLDRWIPRIEALLERHARALDESALGTLYLALFVARMYRKPAASRLAELAARIHAIIERLPDPFLRVTAGSHLLLYLTWWRGDLPTGAALVELLRPQIGPHHASALDEIVWRAIDATYAWMAADTERCIDSAETGLHLADRTGVHLWDFMLLAQAAWSAITSGDLARAGGYLERMAATVQPGRLLDLCHYRYLRFVEALHRGNLPAQRQHAEAALRLAHQAGVPWAEGIVLSAVARTLAAAGDTRGARARLGQAMRIAQRLGSDTIHYGAALARAEHDLHPEGRRAALRDLFEVSARCGFVNSAWWRDAPMADLACEALELDIEPRFVRQLIRVRNLTPPPARAAPECWPWPLQLFTLGELRLLRDGRPVVFRGKAQKKPLELLKRMVAAGARPVSEAVLMDALWPDSDGDAALQALATTVHRLRQIIGAPCILRQAGQLRFDERRCRIDAYVLQHRLHEFEEHRRGGESAARLWIRAEPILRLYRGPFLDGDSDLAWTVSMRERLRAGMMRLLTTLGAALAHEGLIDTAVTCFERGLEIDELSEPCYRGLMETHARRGEHAQAIKIYNCCARLLEARLQARPGPATEALRARIVRS